MSYLFGIETTRPKNVGSGIWNFDPQPEKIGPKGLAGRPVKKNFGIWPFFIKGTTADLGHGSMSWGHRTHPGGPRGLARGWPEGRGVKI